MDSYLCFQGLLLVWIHLFHSTKHHHGSFHVSVHASQGIGPKSRATFSTIPYDFFNFTLCGYASIQCATGCGLLFEIKWVLLHSQSLDSFLSLSRHVSQINLDMKCVKCSTTSSCHLLQITDCTNSPLKHPSIQVDARLQGHG